MPEVQRFDTGVIGVLPVYRQGEPAQPGWKYKGGITNQPTEFIAVRLCRQINNEGSTFAIFTDGMDKAMVIFNDFLADCQSNARS